MSMVLFFVAGGGILTAIANLCMRRSIDAGGSSKGFLMLQLPLSFVVAVLLHPVRTGNYTWNSEVALLGLGAGVIFGVMLWILGQALQRGPSGLTFAVLNSSSVVPAIVMALIFGAAFGHDYHWWNGVGSLFVLAGLFWAARHSRGSQGSFLPWALFAALLFTVQALFMSFLSWRALMLKEVLPASTLIPFHFDASETEWFMPMLFVAASFVHIVNYWTKRSSWPRPIEWVYAIAAGVLLGVGTFSLIESTQLASAREQAMIFPAYCVTIIVACNIWGRLVYKERIHWLGNMMAVIGVLIGTVDWPQIFG